jgi:hypothetical protein
MTDEEFDTFLAKANDELESKQAELNSTYRLGEMKRWWFEQQGAKLQFFDGNDRLAVEGGVVGIGSYSPKSSSWMWAWSNPTFLPELREKALPLKRLEALTGLDLFGNEGTFSISGEAMAWELAAMAVHELGALGCYRAPASSSDGPYTFLAICNLRVLADIS